MNPLSLFNLLEKFLNNGEGGISVNRDYCVRLKSPMASCYECIDRCPDLSIKITDADIQILKSCTNCNACLYMCPNYVFGIKQKSDEEPEKRLVINNSLYYFCSKTNIEKIDDKIECIHEADTLDIITCLKEGNNLFFITGDCNSCKYNYFHNKTIKRVKEIAGFLNAEENFKEVHINEFDTRLFLDALKNDAHKTEGSIKTGGRDGAGNDKDESLDRREFFKNSIEGIKNNAKKFTQDLSVGDLPFSELYSNYIDFGDKNDKKINKLLLKKRKDIFLFLKNNKGLTALLNIRLPKLNKNCVFCGNCWELCPTGALSCEKNKILLEPFLCTGCNLCKDICSFGAVRMYKAKNLKEISKQRILLSQDEIL
ncbi:MAG: 4Fe-4S binding protein [Deltaproteobacteria bacterium]|jgi:ferredoxin|nr:4Fe-4S binding protein [Deltaproteobacteria bacterium]MCL5880003.1 4Fe-4S binding protein [Deltaproteobacteria bacterium]MDA8304710.1 4Fe-4S binding protein [Deltaproteobacteria bacterium]